MKQTCGDSSQLLDYQSGELSEAVEHELESHLFQCTNCSSEAERFAGLATSIAGAIAPVLSPSRFSALEREVWVETVNVMHPGQRTEVVYPQSGRLLVHRLGGVDLSRAGRIDLDLSAPSGEAIWHLENVPFDAERGEILVPCQSHFAGKFPPDIVFSVTAVAGDEREELAQYTVRHNLE